MAIRLSVQKPSKTVLRNQKRRRQLIMVHLKQIYGSLIDWRNPERLTSGLSNTCTLWICFSQVRPEVVRLRFSHHRPWQVIRITALLFYCLNSCSASNFQMRSRMLNTHMTGWNSSLRAKVFRCDDGDGMLIQTNRLLLGVGTSTSETIKTPIRSTAQLLADV